MAKGITLQAMLIMAVASAAAANVEKAISLTEFRDSIGINTHFAYAEDNATVWANYTPLINSIKTLGITHVRDGLIPTYALSKKSATDPYEPNKPFRQYTALTTLAASGVRFNLVTDPAQNYNNQGTLQSTVNAIKAFNAAKSGMIEAVEGMNEADTRTWTYKGVTYQPVSTTPTGANSFGTGIAIYQQDLYNAVKGDAATANVIVIGPSEGGTYQTQYGKTGDSPQPVANGALYSSSDWGNFHPYTHGGNFKTQHFAYGDIPNWYYGNSQSPGVTIAPGTTAGSPAGTRPFAFRFYEQPFQQFSNGTVIGSRPMVATEKGYFTGTATRSVSQSTFAKYVPRIFADDMLYGIKRTYLYELIDEGKDLNNPEHNYGLLYNNGTPKPAYYTLQHLMALTKDTGTIANTGSLDFSVKVTPPAGWQTSDPNNWGIPDTVQHLLLQRSNGTYELLLWNDVASSSLNDEAGNAIVGTARDIDVPDFATTLTFTTPMMSSAKLYSLNPYGTTYADTMTTTNLTLVNNQITINVPDYVVVLELYASATASLIAVPEPATVAMASLPMGVCLLARRRGRQK